MKIIAIHIPDHKKDVYENLCRGINAELVSQGIPYTTSGSRFLVKPDGKRPAPETTKEEAPVVPLGDNLTRDGRKARVLANDLEGGEPLAVAVQTNPGSRDENLFRYRADGTSPIRPDCDLVGHLPPAPVKPREWKVEVSEPSGCVYDPRVHGSSGTREKVLVREVLPGDLDEIEALRQLIEDAKPWWPPSLRDRVAEALNSVKP